MSAIKPLLQDTGLFTRVQDVKLDTLITSAERLSFAAGDLILREGERADAMYVVLDGAVQVFTEVENRVIVLAKLEAGAFFGEQALLPGGAGWRNASVRAYRNSVLFQINKSQFQALLDDDDPLRQRLLALDDEYLRNRLLRQSKFFQSLELQGVLDNAEDISYRGGTVIFREGDEADKLYVIMAGVAAVYQNEAGRPLLKVRLEVGQCFGELGLLDRQSRTATVTAEGPLQVLALSGDRFLESYNRSPEMQAHMQTLQRVYQLRDLGIITQYSGRFMDQDCIITHYELLDGRQFAVAKVIGQEIYNLEKVMAPQPEDITLTTRRYEVAVAGIAREVRLTPEGLIQGITILGAWDDLRTLHMQAIHGETLAADRWEHFERTGSITPRRGAALLDAQTATLCTCMQVERGRIQASILSGCDDLEALQSHVGCGTVCGVCIPLILDMLGKQEWTPVTVTEELPVVAGIRSFRLKPLSSQVQPAQPGQHIVLQARVDHAWVQRAYTLSSAGDETEYYEITVKREPHGTFSAWLFERREDDSFLRVSPPQGHYYWEPNGAPVVCLVAGIGMTPALAICRTMMRRGLSTALHIDYSARHQADFAYLEELQAAAAAHPNIDLTLRETHTAGRLQHADLQALVQRYPGAEFFLCGPSGYLESVSNLLSACHVPSERIHLEVFTHAGDVPDQQGTAAPSGPVDSATAAKPSDVLAGQSNLIETPHPQRPSLPKRTVRHLCSLASDVINATAFDWRSEQRRPQPLLGFFERIATRAANVDPQLPRDYCGMLGAIGKGPLEHQLTFFRRAAKRVGGNRQKALEARARGEPLAPSTPDGDTVAFTLPNPPLVKFEGEHGVDTGWTSAGTGWLMPVYAVKGHTAIKAVLEAPLRFDRGPMPYYYLQQAFGCSTIQADASRKPAGLGIGQIHRNQTWDQDRALLTDMFDYAALEKLAEGMESSLASICREIEQFIDTSPNQIIDLSIMMLRIAYQVIIEATFGNIDFEEFRALGVALEQPMQDIFLAAHAMVNGKRSGIQPLQRDIGKAKHIISRMITAIRNRHAAGELTVEAQSAPLVRLILAGDENGPLDEARLYALVIGIVFTGHETIGYTMAWAFYEMLRNAELVQQIQQEVDDFHQRHGGQGLRPAHYVERPYTQALLYETIRRHPPASAIPRTPKQAGEIPPDPHTGIGAFRYPKDALFLCSVAGLHMDPVIHPDPWTFRPERFMQDLSPQMGLTEQGRRVLEHVSKLEADYKLLAFGAGPGKCPGRAFSMLEFFLVLDAFMRRFTFELADPEREVADSAEIIPGPEPGTLGVRIRRRIGGP